MNKPVFHPKQNRTGTIAQAAKALSTINPQINILDALRIIRSTTKRVACSKYIPHYGTQAAARNLRHIQAGTHGTHNTMASLIQRGLAPWATA